MRMRLHYHEEYLLPSMNIMFMVLPTIFLLNTDFSLRLHCTYSRNVKFCDSNSILIKEDAIEKYQTLAV